MGDAASLTALAVVGLWIAYLVPHKLRHRQQLLESRTDDRFSGSLRVLAVTSSESPRRTQDQRGDCEAGTPKRVELLTPGRGVPVMVQGARAPRGAGAVERPHATQDRVSADAARRAAQQRAAHVAAVARRGAAARRRALLTGLLLTASVVGWAVAGLTTITLAAGLVPTTLLGGVLVMGRRAVVAGQAADAEYSRRSQELARIPAPSEVRGRLRSPRRAEPVVGRAVHPSDSHTEVIARITDETRRTDEAYETDARGAERTATGTVVRTSARGRVVESTDESWEPVPVPLPTYTMKASAPHREPAPLSERDLAPANAAIVADEDASRGAVTGSTLAPASGTASGSIDLDAVLARRRASGQ